MTDTHKKVLDAYRKEAEAGDADAQFNLGLLYAEGEGFQQDYGEAIRWYRAAAAQGHMSAQHNLGVMYDKVLFADKDHAEAMRWYRMAAGQGHAGSQCNLGAMYANGLGVDQDFIEAMRWYRMAADQEDAIAQHNIGHMYEKGEGVAQNDAKAVKWYRMATEQGDDDAREALKAIMREPQSEENMKVWEVVRELVDIHLDPKSEGWDDVGTASGLLHSEKYAAAERYYQSGIQKLRRAKERLEQDGEALISLIGKSDVPPERVLSFAISEIIEDIDYAEAEYETVRSFLERGIDDVPDPTLLEAYEQAMAEKKENKSGFWKSMAIAGSVVLILTVYLYSLWPWLGILVLVVGAIVVPLGSVLLNHPWPDGPWQHPLYDKDLNGIKPAKVLFTRWHWYLDDEHEPESCELQALIRKRNGQQVEIVIPVPIDEEGMRSIDDKEIVDKLISAMDGQRDSSRPV